MQRASPRGSITSCCRGGGFVEYVILLGAVTLIVIGGLRLFGSRVKTKISGQADSVAALDDRKPSGAEAGRGGDGKGGVAPADDGKAVAAGAADGTSAKGVARSSGVTGVSAGETSISAADKASVGSKLTSTVSVDGKSAASPDGPPSDIEVSSFNYYGWVPAGVGVLVLAFVLFKGKRRLEAEAEADTK